MAYSPPVGTVNLSLTGSYTPPVGTVNLSLGFDPALNRTVAISGVTTAPTGRLSASAPNFVRISGQTFAPTGRLRSAYDPNLLSAVHAHQNTTWARGGLAESGTRSQFQRAAAHYGAGLWVWQEADARPSVTQAAWQTADRLDNSGRGAWQEACPLEEGSRSHWQTALHLDQDQAAHWQEGEPQRTATRSSFQVRLPLLTPETATGWRDGSPLTLQLSDAAGEGARLLAVAIEVWQQAEYPGNAPNPGPPVPPPIPPPFSAALRLRCPLPGTALRLGRTQCILIAEREIPIRRSYMSTNSASLVRLPDLEPLPVTAMTVETDFDSWCWALSATLAGPEAFALVQPNPLACEVLATINGQEWTFLLDVPSTQRSFNSDRVTLKGRSRSAWLHDPYTPHQNFSEANAREMVQLAEAALTNTGWTVDWNLDTWVVPAGRYTSWNTPIGVLIRLVNATDDGLYTDPVLQIITAQKRWPVASWLLDAETVDLLIPEAAVITLTQSPVYTPPLNGVYVSGTSHGVLALVKIAGTDGALQPSDPIVEELLCDEAGVAARARGLNVLSDSGAGWTMDAEVLFTPEVGLVKPGLIVSIAGMKGISRSCRISASWSNGLQVKQQVGLERRDVES